MKSSAVLSLVLALSVAVPAVSHAQSGGMKGMEMKDMDMKGMDMKDMDHKSMSKGDKSQATHKAIGVVKKVDAKQGMATLAHEPIKSLNWSAMTMGFQVKDKSLLNRLAVDKKVEFEFVQQGKDYVITTVK